MVARAPTLKGPGGTICFGGDVTLGINTVSLGINGAGNNLPKAESVSAALPGTLWIWAGNEISKLAKLKAK